MGTSNLGSTIPGMTQQIIFMKTTTTLFSFRGRVTLDRQTRRAVLADSRPPTEWAWLVLLGPRRTFATGMDEKIYGIDPDQAQHLSTHFMLQILDGSALCDDDECPSDVAHNLTKRS